MNQHTLSFSPDYPFIKILLWFLRLGLVGTLLTPLIYSSNFFFPYIIPRAVFFQGMIEILFLFGILLIVFCASYRPKVTWLSGAVLIYLLVNIISTLTSVDSSKSFIGSIERSLGLFQLLHLGAFFFLCQMAYQKRSHWNIFLGVSLTVSLYAALDFLIPALFQSGPLPSSVTGNPTFFAAYLIFHLYFAAYLFTQTKKKLLRGILLILILIFTTGIIVSSVRGAFVGLVLGCFFLLAYAAWKHKPFRQAFIGIILILVVGYGFLYLEKDDPSFKKNSVISRITNFSLQDQTVRARFIMWRMALKGFYEKPMLGWGRENYSLVFNKYYDPEFGKIGVGETWEDRSHNIFFDELVYSGMLGFFAYIFLLLMAGKEATKTNILFLALLLSYGTANFFGVDTLNSLLPFFLFLAFLDVQKKFVSQTHESLPLSPWPLGIRLGTIFISLIFSSVGLFLTFSIGLGNNHMHQAISAFVFHVFPLFESHYLGMKQRFQYFPAMQAEALTIAHNVIQDNGQRAAASQDYPHFAQMLIRDSYEIFNRVREEHRWNFTLSQRLIQHAILTKHPEFLDQADKLLVDLISLSPQREIYRQGLANSQSIRKWLAMQKT